MPIEIERKFLVSGTHWKRSSGASITQGYLASSPMTSVRVRLRDDRGFLTIKGNTKGTTRAEYEYEIPEADARELLELCEHHLIRKVRYLVEFAGSCWEVDEFLDENAGLVVAEVELESEDQPFSRPPWLGTEVTHDARYFNFSLSRHPFCDWR